MTTISDWLSVASTKLHQAGINSSKLDSELILENIYKKSRTFLHSHFNDEIPKNIQKKADKALKQRLKYIPIAYIFGYKEFYGRNFIITKNVLIPRPESETIIDFAKEIYDKNISTLIDVGTGSGCIGLTIKLECPKYDVTITDISKSALKIAKLNVKKFNANVGIIQSDLLKNISQVHDVLVANLPYVDKSWEVSPETKYEPNQAIYSNDGGLELIKQLIGQAKSKYIILEADPRQQLEIISFSKHYNYKLFKKDNYVICLKSN